MDDNCSSTGLSKKRKKMNENENNNVVGDSCELSKKAERKRSRKKEEE